MSFVGAFEAKTHFSGILERVQAGEQVIVTRHGHPIAKIIPFESEKLEDLREAISMLKAFGKRHNLSLKGLNWKTLRDEGRK